MRFTRSTICMYANDHPPPHFHVRFNDGREAVVKLSGFTILAGTLSARDIVEPLAWAERNACELFDTWQELNS
jgi:hypothetical protein